MNEKIMRNIQNIIIRKNIILHSVITALAFFICAEASIVRAAVGFNVVKDIQALQPTDEVLKNNDGTVTIIIQAVDGTGSRDMSYSGTALVSVLPAGTETVDDRAVYVDPVLNLGFFPYLPPWTNSNQITFVAGEWTGNILISKEKSQVRIKINDGAIQGTSNEFDLVHGPRAYLLVVLPGETFDSGYYPGTSGSPIDFTAGEILTGCKVHAVDKTYNQVPVLGGDDVIITSSDGIIDPISSEFPISSVGVADISGIRFRGANTVPGIHLEASLKINSETGISNPFRIFPAAYSKVVLCAPDEELIPGGEFRSGAWEGKTFGAVIDQRINTPFEATVYLTDAYFNQAQTPGSGWPAVELYIDDVLNGTFVPAGSREIRIVSIDTKGAHAIKVQEQGIPSRSDSVSVFVKSGDVENFEINGVQNGIAGDLFTIEIIAKYGDGPLQIADDFVGNVDISLVSNGADITYDGVIDPVTAYFPFRISGGGIITVPVRVNYAGESMDFGSDNLQIKVSTHTPTEKYGLSGTFNIYESILSGIVLILPGQEYQPGGSEIKVKTADSIIAGDPFNIEIYAVDNFGNRIDHDGPVELTLSDPDAFEDFGGEVNLIDGYRRHPIRIYTAGDQEVNAAITSYGYIDSSTITVTARTYGEGTGKLLLLAQGEQYKPGWETVGKVGTAQQVVAHTTMTVTVLACDKFYNTDTTYVGGSIRLLSDDNGIARSGISFNNGKAEVQDLYLSGDESSISTVRVTAVDRNDAARTSFSDIDVNPGARFTIVVPDELTVGTTFSMTVDLVNSLTGNHNFNHRISLDAVKVDYASAPNMLAKKQLVLLGGSVTEMEQRYDHVEYMRIKVADDYGRIGYSSVIKVMPQTLKYVVEGPSQATTEDLFDVTVKLYEETYDTYMITCMDDHNVSISIEESDGNPATGEYSIHQIWIQDGEARFQQNYTKAENIAIVASGMIQGFTALGKHDMTINPGAYVKVQIIAPDEIPLPGIPSATGKDSTALKAQAARVGFLITVLAVDQYWNRVPGVGSEREVRLTASDGSLEGFPLASFNGASQAFFTNVTLQVPPRVEVTADDTTHDVFSDSVNIYVTGRTYEITGEPNYPDGRFVTGKDFNITVTYKTYDHNGMGDAIMEKTNFYLVPMDRNLNSLDPENIINTRHQIDASHPNMFETNPGDDGSTTYPIQYTTAEDVIFKAYDDLGWVGHSEVIHFEPEDIYYEIEMPEEAVVGPPDTFTMKIIPRDVNTHTISINYTSDVDIMVTDISNPTNQTDYSLLVERREISGGAIEFEQAITRAGIITFKVRDTNNNESQETSIILLAGPLAHVEEDIPETIEAGATREIHFTFYDHYNNPVRDVPVMLSLDDDLLNFKLGSLNTVSLQSNTLGTSQVRLSAMEGYSGLLFFTVHMGELNINEVIKVLGPPETTLSFGGLARDTFKGHSLKQTDPIILEADYDEELSLERVMYRIDDGEWLEYTGPFTISEVGIHTIEYYSVTIGELEHEEVHKHSLKVFITQATAPDEGLVNYPNPFMAGKESTFLEYYLVQNSNVTLSVYDLLGQKVYERDILAGQMGGVPGLNRIEWDGRNSDTRVIANGGYIAILDIKDEGRTLKRKIAVRK